MLRVEFHCHTIYSTDSLTSPEKLLETCKRKAIDRVVVTDHNSIAGAQAAQELDPERTIMGEEIMTTQGELLGAFMLEEVPPGLSPMETIKRLRVQGAFISVAHPFDSLRKGAWEEGDLLEIIPYVDAIETFNARSMSPGSNEEAVDFARDHNLAATVGSDAHTAYELGSAVLLLPDFKSAEELKAVIREGIPQVSHLPHWVHLSSRYAVWYKKVRGIEYKSSSG